MTAPHPLALLAEYRRLAVCIDRDERVMLNHPGFHGPSPHDLERIAELEGILESALRAQAAAEAVLHQLAVAARDARTSTDRRTALDALERAALALGGE